MNDQDKQFFKDLLQSLKEDKGILIQETIRDTVGHAKNAWGSEDSKIAATILDKMKGHIETTIDNKLVPLNKKLDDYIVSDTEWKKEVTPQIQAVKTVQNFSTASGVIAKAILLIGGVIGMIYGAILWLKN